MSEPEFLVKAPEGTLRMHAFVAGDTGLRCTYCGQTLQAFQANRQSCAPAEEGNPD